MPCALHFWLRVTLLAILTSCSAFGAEFVVVGDVEFPSSYGNPTVVSVTATSERGYLIVGNGGPHEVRVIRVSAAGGMQWERKFAAHRRATNQPTFAIQAEDGGFWIVGRVSEFELAPSTDIDALFMKDRDRFNRIPKIPYLLKIDEAGNLEWRNPLGLKPGFRDSRFLCGARTKDGLVLVGTKTHVYDNQPPPRPLRSVVHPWLIKIDLRGNLIWELAIAGTKPEMLSALQAITARDCSGPYIDGEGAISFGLRIFSYETYQRDEARVVDGPGTTEKGSHSYLAMRVRADGKRIAHAVLRDQVSGILLREGNGFLALFNPVPAFRNDLGHAFLDHSLSVMRTGKTAIPGHSFVLFGAQLALKRGVHAAGELVTKDGTAIGKALLHSSKGEIDALRPLPAQWRMEAYRATEPSDEIALVLRRDSVVRLMRFRFQD